ncbi:hypothetical protein KJ652_04490 [Patescibacteria group bacterium]|nr:hypothetical protein [Patescibacteria group bacterium]MBU1123825.1 hypothetical protein [Patescibacteria group bacterium]MBU1911512.1 hypothetical protein [Patescibacteria group bacterium]
MKIRSLTTGCVSVLLIGTLAALTISNVLADEPSPAEPKTAVNSDACRTAINKRLAKELRIYRTVLFGRRRAEDAAIGEVRFGDEGEAYYKISKDSWLLIKNTKIEDEEEEGIRFSNSDIDGGGEELGIAELDSIPPSEGGIDLSKEGLPRRGILETKRVLSSELIPYLAQAMRSFACRADMVCEQAAYSAEYGQWEDELIPVTVSGCLPVAWPVIPECMFAANDGSLTERADIAKYCPRVTSSLLARESEILKMLAEYDASYRSLLQFAGVFDDFLLEFRWALGTSLRQAASIITWLGRAPCFISSCDDFPPDLDPNNPFPTPSP